MKRTTIHLTNGHPVRISPQDWELVNRYKWFLDRGATGIAYARMSTTCVIEGKRCRPRMHALIMGTFKTGELVDHLSRNGLDNRRENLRIGNKSMNALNTRIRQQHGKTSVYKGVYLDRSIGRWRARLRINGKTACLGIFDVEREAARAYDQCAQRQCLRITLNSELHAGTEFAL